MSETDIIIKQGRARSAKWFRPVAAAFYCNLDSVRSLETLERDFGLVGHKGLGKSKMYHRKDLDAAMERFFGQQVAQTGRMRLAK